MSTEDVIYPAPGFSFSVAVAGTQAALPAAGGVDAGFQEISGVEAWIETEPLAEGGENRYLHQLPRATRHPNLVLRRGYIAAPSFLSEWAAQTVGSALDKPILTRTLVVHLLGASGVPLAGWTFARAWPVRWVAGPFDAMKNAVLTEVLEFSYATVTRLAMNEAQSMVSTVAALIDPKNQSE